MGPYNSLVFTSSFSYVLLLIRVIFQTLKFRKRKQRYCLCINGAQVQLDSSLV